VLKSKIVHVDDIEFIVRTPVTPGVRRIAIHHMDKSAKAAGPGAAAATKKLLARIDLPTEVTK
jgi:hypothetical protein